MFALDTNTVIYFFKGMGRVAEHLLSLSPREVAVPIVVLYELEVGLAKSRSPKKRREQLGAMLARVQLLPFGAEEARVGGRLRARLEQAGTPIGPLDSLIAATALAHGATLVTRSTSEFGRVEGLRLADWYDAPLL